MRDARSILVPFAITAIVGFGSSCEDRSASSADEIKLLSFFEKHSHSFERIRSIAVMVPFIYVSNDHGFVSPPDAFSKEAVLEKELFDLMNSADLNGVNGTMSDWGIRLIIDNSGMAMGGTTTSFVYREVEPKNLVSSFDGVRPNPASSYVYMKVEGHWYLQFAWGG